jgi:hypothetical protein
LSERGVPGLSLLCALLVVACGGKKGGDPGGCSELRACGGDVVGSWQVDALCPDPATATQLLGAQLPADCQDAVQSVDLPSYDLTLGYTATTRNISGTAALNATLNLSASCIASVTRLPLMLSDNLCALVAVAAAPQLQANLADAMLTCKLADTSCACDLTGTLTLDSSANYTVADNQIVEGESAQDYCVSGDRLALRSAQLGQLHARRP